MILREWNVFHGGYFFICQMCCSLLKKKKKNQWPRRIFPSIIFSCLYLEIQYTIVWPYQAIDSMQWTWPALPSTFDLIFFFFFFLTLQVPKDNESWEKYFCYVINIRPQRPAACIPVWICWACTSVQLHTDLSRQAYLSGLACIVSTRRVVSKKIQKKKGNVDLLIKRYNITIYKYS